MKTLIVYDSVFGNTKTLALAMGDAIGARVMNVSECNAADLSGVGLLIAGSPTRAFRPTKPMSTFLSKLPKGSLGGMKAAAFDTRADLEEVRSKFLEFMVKLFGYAAPQMEKQLASKGAVPAAAHAGFLVQGTEGPLKPGESERATAWAQSCVGA